MDLTIGDFLDAIRPIPLWVAVVAWIIGTLLGSMAWAAVKEALAARRKHA